MVVSAKTQMAGKNACMPCLDAVDYYADNLSSRDCIQRKDKFHYASAVDNKKAMDELSK